MKTEFNHATNESPRSGGSKQVTPVVWVAILVAIVVVAVWCMRDHRSFFARNNSQLRELGSQ